MRRGIVLAAMAAIGLVAVAPDAHAALQVERFKVVALTGTQSSDVTWRLADEGGCIPCTRAATENISFVLSGPVVAHVLKRRVHGKLRSVWSVSEEPASAFDVVELLTDASVLRRITSRGPCAEADCSAEAQVPWTIALTGASLNAGGARVGAGPIASAALDSCAYDGARALEPGFGDPAAHLFDDKRSSSTRTPSGSRPRRRSPSVSR